MNVLPDQPLKKQQIIMAAVVSILLPGAGLVLAAVACAIAVRAEQTGVALLFAIISLWSVFWLIILLSL